MKKILIVISLIIQFTSPAIAEDSSNFYINKNFWSSFNWEDAEKSKIWLDPNFQPYQTSNEMLKDGLDYHHNQLITIDGRTFNNSLVRKTNKIINPHFLTLALKNVNSSDCDTFLTKWNKSFGNNGGMIDNSHFLMENFPYNERTWQWDVGNTRITMQCISMGSNEKKNVSFKYQPIEPDNKIDPPIHLNCSRKYMMSEDNSKQWVNAQPLAISILPSKKTVTNSDMVFFGKVESYSNSNIEFTIQFGDFTHKYLVSRIDGTLTGNLIDNESRLSQARFEGICETRIPNVRKF